MPGGEDVPVPDEPGSSAGKKAPRPLRAQASSFTDGCQSCR